jgi:hypothetical protein
VFEQFAGLPAHPLLVHAAVVFVPLLAVAAVLYAVVPFLRSRIGWAVGLLAVAAPVAAVFAKLSGDAFDRRMRARNLVSQEFLPRIAEHQNLGESAMYATLGLGAVTLVLLAVAPGRPAAPAGPDHDERYDADLADDLDDDLDADPSPRPGRGSRSRRRAAPRTSPVLRAAQVFFGVAAIGLAVVSVYFVYKTGDSGASMVWGSF